MTTCSIEGCADPELARGYCNRHYKRFRRHGDPSAGGTAKGEPEKALAAAMIHGDREMCLIWPFAKNDHGYGVISRNRKMHRVSRIICENAHGKPPTSLHEAAHNCGRGHLGCVNRFHLRWATTKENAADKVGHGTSNRGEKQGLSKLTEMDVKVIRTLAGDMQQQDIAAMFNVSGASVSNIIKRKCWSWL